MTDQPAVPPSDEPGTGPSGAPAEPESTPPPSGEGPEASGAPSGAEAAAADEPMPIAPAEPVTAAPRETPPPAMGPEQIEWRPVDTGGKIEWQPVTRSSDTGSSGVGKDPATNETAGGEAAGIDTTGEDAVDPDAEMDDLDAELAAMTREGALGAASTGTRTARSRRPATTKPREDPDGGGPKKTKRQVVILSVLTVAVLLIGIFGFVLSRGASKKGTAAGTATSTTAPGTGTTVPASQLNTFHDDLTGFTIKYPKSWNRLLAPVEDIRTVLLPGQNNAVQVRVIPIQVPADQNNIDNFKAVTDTIVFGDNTAQLIQEQLVTLNGKLCYYYLYTFTDQPSGQTGVHATYFVFFGYRIYELVFQALPADQFSRLANVFDQVAESFTVDPDQATTTSTVTPPTTTG